MKDLIQWIRNQSDRVASWACIGLGVVCLVAGWVGVSATAFMPVKAVSQSASCAIVS